MYLGRFLALLLVGAAPAAAQKYANLYGRVLDTSEGGIGQAAVSVINEDTGFRRSAESEPGGAYSVSSLQPGVYKIIVRKEGFRTVVRFGVRLTASAAARADFVLPVGSIEESITVLGTAPLIPQDDASTGSRVDREEIERLPLNGRGLLTLLETAPGANVTPATRGEAGQFTVTGQRPNTNYFTVDGMSANTGIAAGGLPAQSTGGALPALSAFGSMDSLISLEAVQEFRITTSTSVAEFGRLPGAQITLNSRSGSNEFHGSFLYRFRHEALSANDWFGNQAGYGRLPLRLHNLSQTFGGPVRRNRTFFFLSYERIAMRQPLVWRQTVPSVEARTTAASWAQPLLALFPAPTAPSLSSGIGEWTGRTNRAAGLNTGGARVDQAIGAKMSLFARYNDSPSMNEFGALVTNHLDLRSRSFTLGWNARVTANHVVDLRVNQSKVEADSLWLQGDGCSLAPLTANFFNAVVPCDYLVRFSIGGVGQLVSGREGDRSQRQFQAIPSASLRLGRHSVAVGADYRRIFAVRRDPTGALAVLADGIGSLTDDKRNLWISKAEPSNSDLRLEELSVWVQDTFQISSRLTVAAGLRWEHSPAPVADKAFFLDLGTNTVFDQRRALWPSNYRQFAPRLGIAWRLRKNGRTVLRAGAGLYYASSMSIATDMLNGGPLNISSFSSAIVAPFSAQLTFGFTPGLRLPRIGQWNISVEHALGTHDVLSLGYVGAFGHRLIRREMGGAGSTESSPVALTTNHGDSNYHALDLQYRRRVSRGLQAMASYAWAHSLDNDSSDAYLAWVGKNGSSDRASSDFDLRHTFTASASYELPRLPGWSVDAIFRARTSFPITLQQSEQYLGINLSNAFRPDLVYGVPLWVTDPQSPGGRRLNPAAFAPTAAAQQGNLGRNVLGGFGSSQFDLAIRKEFRWTDHRRLQLRLEAYNALNQANFGDPVRYLNSPEFGQSISMLNMMLGTGSPGSGLAPILQTGAPRSLQGSVRFQF